MKAPTLKVIKEVIARKGYGDLFEVEVTEPTNNVSGEIPVDFLYHIVMNNEVNAAVRKVLMDNNYSLDKAYDLEANCDLIQKFFTEIDKNNLIPKAPHPSIGSSGFANLSKLLFIGIRCGEFGTEFDDLLIVTTRDGDIFETFEACTDIDLGKTLPGHDNTVVGLKPGFYMDLFELNNEPNGSPLQVTDIDLFVVSNEVAGPLAYKHLSRGMYNLTIDSTPTETSTYAVTTKRFAAELKYPSDGARLISLISTYMSTKYVGNKVHKIGDVEALVLGYMSRFPYLLLTEKDFE